VTCRPALLLVRPSRQAGVLLEKLFECEAYLLEALALATEHLSLAIAVLDVSGHVVLVNAPGQRLLGLRASDPRSWTEQVAGYQVREAARGRFVATAERPLARALAGEAVLGWEGRMRPPRAHQDTWLVASAVPLRDDADRVKGAVGIYVETSRLHRLALELRGCLREQARLLARVGALDQQTTINEPAAQAGGSPEIDLSPRERDIVQLIGRGHTNREIAANLGMGLRTVKTHIEHLFRKLGVSHRIEAAMWAERRLSGPK
jgi:DNA-binding CsgD family transcriptional regulator